MVVKYLPVAYLPAVRRDLYLARVLRRLEDAPASISTLKVRWSDMVVLFTTNEAISEASVSVAEDISIAVFTRRMESLLNYGTKTDGTKAEDIKTDNVEWVLKWADKISRYGTPEEVRRLLCDKIVALDGQTGETIGVLKIKRRSVNAGYAKVRLVPAEDSLQLVCRHTTAQGLKAVWKSVLWRLKPQHGSSAPATPVGTIPEVLRVVPPCVLVRENKGGYYFDEKAGWLSEQGYDVDLSKDIDVTLPISRFAGSDLPSDTAEFYFRVELRRLPAGKPKDILIYGNILKVSTRYWADFAQKAKAVSDWLGLGWEISGQEGS